MNSKTNEVTDRIRSKDNLRYQYYLELLFWNNSWSERRPVLMNRLDESVRCHCPAFAIDLVKILHDREGTRPKVLDFGCGPFSTLCFLHKKGLAETLGIDALAREYHKLYKQWKISPPIPLRSGTGESLPEDLQGEQFDFVYVQNALDHCLSPALTWLNLYRATKIGGYIGHSHAINEATHENQKQLHQFDLRPSGEASFVIDDLSGNVFSLTDGLQLELHFHKTTLVKENYSYFTHVWRKTGEEIGCSLLENALDDLRRAFLKRAAWASRLEDDLLSKADIHHKGLSYNLFSGSRAI